MVTIAVNPYLDRNFAPIHKEITTDKLPVIGELPVELSGMFVRNGPNPQWEPIGEYHWFDGDGMLHGVQISNGVAPIVTAMSRQADGKKNEKRVRLSGVGC